MTTPKMLSDAEMLELEQRWAAGESRAAISERFGIPVSRLFDKNLEKRQRGKLAHPRIALLPDRRGQGGGAPRKDGDNSFRDPDPPTIARRCEAIQRTWDPIEKEARRRGMTREAMRRGFSTRRDDFTPARGFYPDTSRRRH
jgi:GNAT superfamily N-acetyltransferase